MERRRRRGTQSGGGAAREETGGRRGRAVAPGQCSGRARPKRAGSRSRTPRRCRRQTRSRSRRLRKQRAARRAARVTACAAAGGELTRARGPGRAALRGWSEGARPEGGDAAAQRGGRSGSGTSGRGAAARTLQAEQRLVDEAAAHAVLDLLGGRRPLRHGCAVPAAVGRGSGGGRRAGTADGRGWREEWVR